MIPQKLTINGFLSYRDETVIDFTGLHVACISGANGAGKSAMLDAITWALFGNARKSDETIINNSGSGKAEVTFDFLYENEYYRIIRKRTRSRSQSLEFLVKDPASDTWKPLTEKTPSQTNQRICDTLRMDYETFINASFFLQGKADRFTGQKASDRKQILGTILNLDIWEEYRQRAADRRKEAEAEQRLLSHEIEEADKELDREEEMREELAEAERCSAETESAYKDADKVHLLASQAHSECQSQERIVSQLENQDTALSGQIDNAERQTVVQRKKLEGLEEVLQQEAQILSDYAALKEARQKVSELTGKSQAYHALVQHAQTLESQIREAEAVLENNIRNLRIEENRLNADLLKLPGLRDDLKNIEDGIKELQKTAVTGEEHRRNRDALREQFSEIKGRISIIDNDIQEIGKKQQNIAEMKGAPCPHCGQTMDAARTREHLADLQRQAADLSEKRRAEKAALDQVTAQGQEEARLAQIAQEAEKEILQKEQAANPLRSGIMMLETQKTAWDTEKAQKLAAFQDTLDREDFCLSEREQLRESKAQIDSLRFDQKEFQEWQERVQCYEKAESRNMALQTAKEQNSILRSGLEQNEAMLADLNRSRDGIREDLELEKQKLRQMKENAPDLSAALQAKQNAEVEKNRALARKTAAAAKLANLENVRTRAASDREKLKEKKLLISRLQTLEKYFGKNGIPAMLIEQALPEIEEHANSILSQLTNGRMSVRFATQKEYKSNREDMKETLDILISDEYGTRPYELFSGGEAFRINFALRLALSRLLSRRAGSRLQTLVIDEGFGSQDEEGLTRLVDAITMVQDDFEKILVITHLNELKDAFPSRIEVEKGENGSHVEVYV